MNLRLKPVLSEAEGPLLQIIYKALRLRVSAVNSIFIRRLFFLVLTLDLRLVLVHQYSISRTFKVIKLVRAYRPHKYPHDDDNQDQGEGDE